VVAIAIVVACNFHANPVSGDATLGLDDAPTLQDAYVSDAGPCQALGPTCEGPTLRTCTTVDQLPTDTKCAWGCSTVDGAHCAKLQPSGGTLQPTDLDPNAALTDQDVFLINNAIDTNNGSIQGIRSQGIGVINGIEFTIRNNVGIFRFKKVTLGGNRLDVRGTNALAIIGIEGIAINARIDATGDCNSNLPGAGGFAGGAPEAPGTGPGAGGAGTEGGNGANTNMSGGAGGGYGDTAGGGGNGTSETGGTAGTTYGDPLIALLQGGAGGGGGGGTSGGRGGGGGGAVQLASNGTIRIQYGVEAGGCGGRGTSDVTKAGAGGGGAGGTILIEAPNVEISAYAFVTVNGGGGGGAGSNRNQDGEDSKASSNQASGGAHAGSGGGGGKGGADNDAAGGGGDAKYAGAGGGAVGRIRINTLSVETTQISDKATISPRLGTTATTGIANAQ